MTVPVLIFTALSVLIGLFPNEITGYLLRIAGKVL